MEELIKKINELEQLDLRTSAEAVWLSDVIDTIEEYFKENEEN
jgi:hypothetical protein